MLKKILSIYRKELIVYLLITLLLMISSTLFVSLNITSNTIKQNTQKYAVNQNKNEFVIAPSYNQLDQLIQNIPFYDFDQYQAHYQGSPYALDYDNIKNIKNNQYLTKDEEDFISHNITDDFITRIKNSNRPSYVIYTPIREMIYQQIDPNLPEVYRNKFATDQAKEYTRVLLLLTLNEHNYMQFVEYTLDNELLAKDENNHFLPSTIASQYNLTIEKKKVIKLNTQIHSNQVNLFLSPLQETFNKPYVIDSLSGTKNLTLKHHEIAIFKEFAESNHLKLGDSITINQTPYQITAYVDTPDTIYPILSPSQYFYQLNRDTLVIMNQDDFTQFNNNDFKSIIYTAKFNQTPKNLDQAIEKLKQEFNKNNLFLVPKYNLSDEVLDINISNLSTLSYILSSIILIISVLFMSILLIRKINQEQKQIGILKALGYYKKEIMLPYLYQYLGVTFIGIFLGSIIGFFLSQYLLSYMYQLFLIPLKQFHISLMTIIGLFIPFIVIFGVCIIILLIKINKKAVQLLNQSDTIYIKNKKFTLQLRMQIVLISLNLILTFLAVLVTKIYALLYIQIVFLMLYGIYKIIMYKKRNYINQLSNKMSNRNIKKIISFNITVFFTTFLFLFIFNSMSVYQDLTLKINNLYKYNQYVRYPSFSNLTQEQLNDCPSSICEGFSTYTFEVLKKNQDDINQNISISGYDEKVKMVKSINTNLLINNQVIVTPALAEMYHIQVNDTLTIITNKMVNKNEKDAVVCSFDTQEYCQTKQLKVVDISENPTGSVIYGNLKQVNSWYYGDDKHETAINTLHITKDIATVFPSDSNFNHNILITYRLNDILQQISQTFYTIVLITNYAIIFFSLISIIILLLIMELTIKENTIQIAQLKAFGYHNKEIKKMLLSQYHPYIFILFFFTLPLAYFGSYELFYPLGLKMKAYLAINLHLKSILITLAIMISIYQVTTYLSFFRIKRISLASWLKKD